MGIEEKKSAMDGAVEKAVKSVDEKLGGANERSIDKAFLVHLQKQITESKQAGRGLTHADLSEVEQHHLQKIALYTTGLTDEELNTLAALGVPKKKE